MVEGFKNTEIGVIPEDWDTYNITNVIDNINGIKIGPFGSQLKKELLTKSGYKVYGQENVYVKNMEIGERYIPKEHFQKLNSCEIRPKDFLISMMGTIGKCLIVPDKFESGIMDSHLIRLRLNQGQINSELLLHFFNSNLLINQVKKLSVGGIMDGLSSKIVKQIQIPLPPTLAEQTAIATALNDADALISSLEKLIAKKKAIKQGAMQELLKPKEGWETKTLGEIAIIRDGTHQTPHYVKQGIPFYSVENVTANDFKNTKFITQKEHAFLTKNWKIEKGDILMTRIGSIGVCKHVTWEVDASFYVSLALLKINTQNSASFICHYSQYEYFKKEIELNSLQFAYPQKINLGQISKVKLIIPESYNEQVRIAQILSDMDNEIEQLEAKLEKQKQLKQGMMQSLLTGKIRLV